MPNRSLPRTDALRLAAWQLTDIGREIRLVRVMSGRTQMEVGRAVGTSMGRISMVERGLVGSITYRQLAQISAALGLKLYLRAFPAGRRLLDQPQLDLLAALRARAHPAWTWATEVPMPIPGDLRAGDATATIPGCVVLCELWTRLADWQAQSRSALLKQRDLRADRLIVVLKGTRANREALRLAGLIGCGRRSRWSRAISCAPSPMDGTQGRTASSCCRAGPLPAPVSNGERRAFRWPRVTSVGKSTMQSGPNRRLPLRCLPPQVNRRRGGAFIGLPSAKRQPTEGR